MERMPLRWVLSHQYLFLKALLFIMMDLTGEVSNGAVDMAKYAGKFSAFFAPIRSTFLVSLFTYYLFTVFYFYIPEFLLVNLSSRTLRVITWTV